MMSVIMDQVTNISLQLISIFLFDIIFVFNQSKQKQSEKIICPFFLFL